MKKSKTAAIVPLKKENDKSEVTYLDDEELGFLEYQESLRQSASAKRNKAILLSLFGLIYAFGIIAICVLTSTLASIHQVMSWIVGGSLFVAYTIFLICLYVSLRKKKAFDLSKNKQYSEKYNNKVRWDMARNILEQKNVLNYPGTGEYSDLARISELVEKVGKKTPKSTDPDSVVLAAYLASAMEKGGFLYKKGSAIVRRTALKVGGLTMLSTNAMLDGSVALVKNLQMIKSLVYLYGFRPTDAEMNRLLIRIASNVAASLGISSLAGTLGSLAGSVASQLLGKVIDLGIQLVGNTVLTYLLGRTAIKVILKEYRAQDLFRKQMGEEGLSSCLPDDSPDTLNSLKDSAKAMWKEAPEKA